MGKTESQKDPGLGFKVTQREKTKNSNSGQYNSKSYDLSTTSQSWFLTGFSENKRQEIV
jgi:hypothetical protein